MYVITIANTALFGPIVHPHATDLSRQPRHHKHAELWLHSTLNSCVISAIQNSFQATVSSPRSPSQTAKDGASGANRYWLVEFAVICGFDPRKADIMGAIYSLVCLARHQYGSLHVLVDSCHSRVVGGLSGDFLAARAFDLNSRDDVTLRKGSCTVRVVCWGSGTITTSNFIEQLKRSKLQSRVTPRVIACFVSILGTCMLLSHYCLL
jgi:hypothetical protein